jgi:MFS family permease
LAARENTGAIRKAAIIVVAGVLATTLAQPGVLGLIPLKNLLKNELGADRAATSAFFFLIGIPWYIKPVTGILTDAFPLFGRRRKSYLLLSAAAASLAWIGLYFTPRTYDKLVLVCLIIAFFMVLASTVVGAYMVEPRKRYRLPAG